MRSFLTLILLIITAPITMAQNDVFKAYEFSDLEQQHEERGNTYLRFLNAPSMSMGLYILKAGAYDGQSPHDLDEVYYIVEGKAILTAGEHEIPVEAGSIVYVKAEVSHRFHTIEEDLKVLVVFPTITPEPNAPVQEAYTLEGIEQARKAGENVWNPFLQVPSMTMGLYMLPKALGGDNSLTHQVDEVNIVTKGTATFKVGDQEIKVKPGSIVYVKDGNGHSFHSLSEDFDVLILFEKRN